MKTKLCPSTLDKASYSSSILTKQHNMRLITTLSVIALPVYGAVHESLAGLPFGWEESSVAVDDNTQVSMTAYVYVATHIITKERH